MKRLFLLTLLLPSVLTAQFQVGSPGQQRPPDTPLLRLGNPETRKDAIEWYRAQGEKAVPGLLKTLQDPSRARRLLSLSALQYSWSEAAVNPVLGKLVSSDASERNLAWAVLNRHLRNEELFQRIEPGLHRMDPKLVASVLPRLESVEPSLERIKRLAAHPRYAEPVLMWLPRYSSPDLIPLTRRLALQTQSSLRSMAIAALIHQQDTDPQAQQAITAWLADPDARVRELAAEYFRWHGDATAIRPLQARVKQENDVFVLASLNEAMRILEHRATLDSRSSPPPPPDIEPFYRYDGNRNPPQAEGQKRLLALRSYAGYPAKRESPTEVPPAGKLISPTRSFWLKEESNYGNHVGAERGGPFANSVHVGIDVSWREDMAAVVAIGPGRVRHMRVGTSSWGGIVVVEHTDAKGDPFCSLYAHLGPLVTVQVGDVVAQGDKLGSLGRNYSWENGGYRAHLHFGLHKGSYGDGSWITGYLHPNRYRQGNHGWHAPRQWISRPLSER